MKIVVDINHPAHVHYFKNFIWEMEQRGNNILITASHKDISFDLLNAYEFKYAPLGSYGKALYNKIINIPRLDLRMYNAVKEFDPDLFLGFGSIRAAHISKLMKKPCISLDDSEPAIWEHLLYVPFSDYILTPLCFKKSFGYKHIKYDGFTELAYLHPNYFKPDSQILRDIGIDEQETFFVLRFVSWNAGHDLGQRGLIDKKMLIEELEKHGKIIISSEGPLEIGFEKYRMKLSPEKMHDLLFYSKLLIGDSQTMTTEAGVLGTPAIRCNTFVGAKDMGNFIELEKKYGLIFNYNNFNNAFNKIKELVQNPNLKNEWKTKRDRLLADKIDLTAFLIWLIENYPESFQEAKRDSNIAQTFK